MDLASSDLVISFLEQESLFFDVDTSRFRVLMITASVMTCDILLSYIALALHNGAIVQLLGKRRLGESIVFHLQLNAVTR